MLDTPGVLMELGTGLQQIAALGLQATHTCLQKDDMEALGLVRKLSCSSWALLVLRE